MSELLKFGVCVKTCPTGKDPVICKKPTYMIQQEKNYKDCQFLVGGITPFRYDTQVFASKFCVPTSEALKTTAVAAFNQAF